jgi:hypothetical protein
MHKSIRVTKAVWDKRAETKLLQVEVEILVYGQDDQIALTKKVPPGINDTILMIEAQVIPGSGPKKGHFRKESKSFFTTGNEPWRSVEVLYDEAVDSMPITVLQWAAPEIGQILGDGGSAGGSRKGDGNDTGGSS